MSPGHLSSNLWNSFRAQQRNRMNDLYNDSAIDSYRLLSKWHSDSYCNRDTRMHTRVKEKLCVLFLWKVLIDYDVNVTQNP